MSIRTGVSVLALISMFSAHTAFAQDRVFKSDAGMMFHPILPEKASEFEEAIKRVHAALLKSTSEVRRRQAQTWKVFRSIETVAQGNSILYIFVVDPALEAADYSVARILEDELPAEAQELYDVFQSCYASPPSLINLRLVADFSGDELP